MLTLYMHVCDMQCIALYCHTHLCVGHEDMCISTVLCNLFVWLHVLVENTASAQRSLCVYIV